MPDPMTSMKRLSLRSPFAPIFLTIFIDMLGVGIIIPVLPALFFEEGTMLLGPELSYQRRSLLYGLLLASYPFMQFFGAPVLGSLSDRFGRKPMLQISLVGTCVGYFIFGQAILHAHIGWLFFSRMLPGFTGGNIAIVYSAIADVSEESAKAKNFGLVGVAFGLGFILGPTLGGVLADPGVVAWFSPSTPFWFTAALTIVNFILVQGWFRETLQYRRATRIHPFKGLVNIATSMRAPNLRIIFLVVLFQALGFTFFTQFFSVLLIEKIGAGLRDIGFLFGYVGVWLVFTQGVVVRLLSRRVASHVVLKYSMVLLSTAILTLTLPSQLWLFYLINPVVAIFHGITSPNLTAVVSAQAARDQQGEILGINQSMISIGLMLPALIGSWLNTYNVHLPILASSVFILTAWAIYLFVFVPKGRIVPPSQR
jgi:DHA1 family tetracycline resistance protein-like MFS transporter